MNQFYTIMEHIGMSITKNKTLGPTQILQYLRFLLNFIKQTIQIPIDKRQKYLKLITEALDLHKCRKAMTVKKIQSLAGSLNYICATLPARKVFLTSLYQLLSGPHPLKLGHHHHLTAETVDDLCMFQSFLTKMAHKSMHEIPFLMKQGISSDELQLFLDTAGASNLSFGVYLKINGHKACGPKQLCLRTCYLNLQT